MSSGITNLNSVFFAKFEEVTPFWFIPCFIPLSTLLCAGDGVQHRVDRGEGREAGLDRGQGGEPLERGGDLQAVRQEAPEEDVVAEYQDEGMDLCT